MGTLERDALAAVRTEPSHCLRSAAPARARDRARALRHARPGRPAATVLVLGLLLLGAAAAEAQTSRILVSNVSQGSDDVANTSGNDHAQLFHTGDFTDGYRFTSVIVVSEDADGDTFDVDICTADTTADEFPTSTCTALTAPASFTAGNLEFTGALNLSANTNYVVVVKPRSGANVAIDSTTSGGEDSTSIDTDWSIKNYFYWKSGTTWMNQSGTNEVLQITVNGHERRPTVAAVRLSSMPGSDNTYAIGDSVAATVTFDALVDITGTPQLELDFDGTAKAAGCTAATNTISTVCEYEVEAGDSAPNGVAIAANKLTGGTITVTGSTTTADLDHTAVAINAGHKVDGIRPTLLTTGSDAPGTSVDGTEIYLRFSEALSSADSSRYTVQISTAGSNVTSAVTSATISGSRVTVTHSEVVSPTSTVGIVIKSRAVADLAGNDNDIITEPINVINNVPPPAPTIDTVALTSTPGVDNTYEIGDAVTATVTFDAAVDITGAPQLELDFDGTAKAATCATGTNTTTMACSYTVLTGDSAPNGVAIAANKLTGGTITATGSTTITADLTHTAVMIDAGHTVDGIRPTLVTTGSDAPKTSTDGTQVILTFSEDISAVSLSDIDVTANGTAGYEQGATETRSGRTVTLTLLSPSLTIQAGWTVTVELDADAVADAAGNGNLALAATTVTNAVGSTGVTVSTMSVTVTEQDATGATYTVVLDTQPTAAVTITVAGHASTAVTAAPTSLAFTSGTWSTAQTVTVTAGDDANTANETVTLTHSAASTDTGYSGITIADVDVTVEDNDTAPVTGVMIEPGNGQLVVQWTAVDNATGYEVQWKSGVQSYHSTRQAAVTPGTTTDYTIPSLTNGTAYTVRVRATRTGANAGPYSAEEMATPMEPTGPGVTVSTMSVTVTEEDPTGATYTVVLDTQPTVTVTIMVGGFSNTDVTANPASLTFMMGTWSTARTVRVTAGADTNTVNETVTLTHSAASTDPGYSGIAIADVEVTVEDNDRDDSDTSTTAPPSGTRTPPPPPNTPPEMAVPLVAQEATAGAAFTYVVPAFTDADDDPLTYAAALSDGGRLPAWLTFDPATRTFTGRPGPGDAGTVRVTVMVSDGTATISHEFTLMVTVPNTPPEVATPLADQEAPVDVPFTYGIPADAFTDADGDPLTYGAATNNNGGLPGWLTFDPATRTFTGTPAASDSGTVRVTVTANDGTATVSDAFALRVLVVASSTLRAWTSRFGRTVATHVTDAVGERLRVAPGQDSHVTVGGYRLPLGRQAAGTAGPDATAPETVMDPEPPTKPKPPLARLTSLLTGLVGRALGLGPAPPQGGDRPAPRVDQPEPDPRLGQSHTLPLPTVRLRDVLLGSSFRLNLGDDDAAPGHLRLTAWGRVAGTQFTGRDGALTLDGDVLTGTVGVDSEWDRWLAGVAVSHSLGGGAFTGDGAGDLDSSTLTSLHPYLRYAVNERVEVWSVLGYGWGDMTLEPETGGTLETDTTLLMGSFGGRGILLSALDNAGYQLATRTDAMLTRTTSGAVAGLAATDAEAHRLRLVLEGTRDVTWPEGQRLTPTVELGVRHDWGDAETGFGLELGGRVQYADPTIGLTLEAAVRGLLAHEDSDYEEWGASGSLRIDPGADGQGLALTLAPTWGAASSGVDGLWSRQTTAGLAPQGTRQAPAGRLNAEVRYGIPAPLDTGLLTPYAGTVLAEGAARTYRLGTRWITVSGLTLTLEGTRQEPVGQQPVNQGLRLQVTRGF